MAEASEIDVTKMSLDELKEECRKLNIKVSGNKATLQQRVSAAMKRRDRPETGTPEDSTDDEEDEELHDHEVGREDSDRIPTVINQPLTFKDVEDSLQTFSGDGRQNVRRWLEDFNETSEVCLWSESQKVIYARKLLRGSARLFVTYEKRCNTWKKLEKALISEFGKTVNSRHVHKELARTKKRNDESYHEYVYRMMEIASHADLEEEAKIQYIIDGIQDDPVNKTILYGAQNIKELRKRLTQYETMKNAIHQKSKQLHYKPTKDTTKGSGEQRMKTEEKRCYNCGERNHLGANCPLKVKGTKCFSCGEFGHIATRCGKKEQSRQVNECTVVSKQDNKVYKTVNIQGTNVVALLDTGSDLNLIRAEQYIKLMSPPLTRPGITCKSLGAENVSTIGSFVANVQIDQDIFCFVIHVVSDVHLSYNLLLGSDLLQFANITWNGTNVVISKRAIESNESDASRESLDIPEVFCIDVFDCKSVDQACLQSNVNVENIEDPAIKHELQDIIADYQPQGTKQVAISLSLVLKDEIPVYERARRLAPAEREQVNAIVRDWLQEGIIRPSTSEYASPVVLAKKKDGAIRLCVDYRKLNRKIFKDRYPLPLIEDQLDRLQGSVFFSTIDLKDGFFHVPIEEDSRKYTAFIVPDGHYEFLKTPFGLCNSPAIFQKYINAIFRELIAEGVVLTYLDDLIIPSGTEKEGLCKLKRVLSTASDYGLNVRWNKCYFLQRRIEYLGHVIENGSVRPSKQKTQAVMNFPVPIDVKQVQSFLGLTGYFRKFIPRYSLIARPLSDLLKDKIEFRFDEEQRQAFDHLKAILSQDPVLKLYRVGAETELHTDASNQGFGAIVLQKNAEDQLLHPVYYASWKTTDIESRYTSYELEVLAIIKSLIKFRVYLLGISFKIVTDCQAFSLTMNKKDLCARVARWALLLEEFSYTIEHRPGKSMRHVDALSRNPSHVMLIRENSESIVMRLARAQRDDENLKPIFETLKYKAYDDFVLQNHILYKKYKDDLLLVVPKAMQREIIKQTHEKGHFAVKKVEQLLKKEFWFTNMRERIESVIRNCVSCILSERKHGKPEGFLHNVPKGNSPLDTYHADHLGPITGTKKGYVHLLVVVDAFSKFTWLYPTKSTTSEETIARLMKQATVFGNPRQIVTDRGTAFTSHVFRQYCEEQNIQHILCTTGVPRGNGQVERANRIVIPVLSKLAAPKPESWYKYVDQVQQYINSSPSRSTGFSPFELLIGKNMFLKDDLALTELLELENVKMLQEDRNQMREQASQAISKIQQENQVVYNRKRKKPNIYKRGELVAIRRTQYTPGNKLNLKYLGPYKVEKLMGKDRYKVSRVGEHAGPRVTTTSVDNMKRWLANESDVSCSDISDNDMHDEDNHDLPVDHQGLMSCQNGRVVGPRSPILTRLRSRIAADPAHAQKKTSEVAKKKAYGKKV